MGALTGVRKPAPPRPSDEGGGGGGWSWLLTASGIVEAELVRGRLETAGVPVVLDRRDPSPGAWLYLSGGNPRAPVKVYVPSGLLDAARLELLEAGLFAPETASEETPPPRGRSWAWWLLAALTALVVAWIVVVQIFGSATCALGVFCG